MTMPGFFQTLTQRPEWLALFLDLALKGFVILVLATLVARALRKSAASARHLVWSLAVAGLLAVPLLRIVIPGWNVPILPPPVTNRAIVAGATLGTTEVENAERQNEIDLIPEAGSVRGVGTASRTTTSRPSAQIASLETPAVLQAGVGALPGSEDETRQPTAAAVTQAAASPPESDFDLALLSPSKYPTVFLPGGELWSGGLTGSAGEWGLLVLLIWGAGAFAFLTRLVLASARVGSIARRADRVTDPVWISLADALREEIGLRSRVKLLMTERVSMPATWGLFRAVVLLPAVSADWSPECRRIVLLHELSHIKRRDCLTQMLAQVATALHWFNPLAWTAARRLRVERELACDDGVLEAGTRPTDYAGHLVQIAASFEPVSFASPMTVAMACSQLESRVRSILNPNISRRGLKKLRVVSSGLLCLLLLAPLSALRPGPASAAVDNDRVTSAVRSAEGVAFISEEAGSSLDSLRPAAGEQDSVAISASLQPTRTASSGSDDADTEPGASSVQERDNRTPAEGQGDDGIHRGAGSGTGDGSGVGNGPGTGNGSGSGAGVGAGIGLEPGGQAEGHDKSAGGSVKGRELTADELTEMKARGLTQESLETARGMGFENLTLNQLSQLKLFHIDEQFLSQVRRWGYEKPTINQLVQLRVAGMTTDYLQSLKNAGLNDLSINRVVSLKMQGVTPAYIETIRRAGYDRVTPSQLVSLRTHGVTEQYIAQTQAWTGEKLSVEELVQFRIFDVTPETAREMKGLGLGDVPVRKLVSLKVHGITASFINDVKALGFDNVTADQLIRMRVHGMGPEYIRKLRAAGFKNISLERMIELRASGVDQILLRNSR
jgi:hypothetical protein